MGNMYKGMDEDELEDDEKEILEMEESKPRLKRPIKPLVPQQRITNPVRKKRYVVFNNPANAGIGDSETGQIVVEGELGVYHALAEILERLERIEYKIGNILEG